MRLGQPMNLLVENRAVMLCQYRLLHSHFRD